MTKVNPVVKSWSSWAQPLKSIYLFQYEGFKGLNISNITTYVHVVRELTYIIPIWAYYPQLGISNSQMGVIYIFN